MDTYKTGEGNTILRGTVREGFTEKVTLEQT